MVIVNVRAAPGGWSVDAGGLSDSPMLFSSGRKAENAARTLFRAASRAGRPAEVRIYLKSGALAGGFRTPEQG